MHYNPNLNDNANNSIKNNRCNYKRRVQKSQTFDKQNIKWYPPQRKLV